jgi:hypothetical protein
MQFAKAGSAATLPQQDKKISVIGNPPRAGSQ